MIDKHFPKGHKLHKCFNRNTVKATYCTLSNMMDKIGKHNGKVLKKESEPRVEIVNGIPEKCCRDQFNCPLMPDRCDQRNVIYQADVYAVGNKKMSYYGLTENEFKKRCSTHKSLFRTTLKQSYRSSFVFWGDFVLGDFVPTTNLPYSMYTITVNTHIDQVLYFGGILSRQQFCRILCTPLR